MLSKEVQAYINDNLRTDIHRLLLKKSPFPKVSSRELVEQIESKNKSKQKLPSWFVKENIYYPNKLNLSQSSSESTAAYKAGLIKGNTIVDLTGGFGADCAAFSQKMNRVVHVERHKELSDIARHNFNILGIRNIECLVENSIVYLNNGSLSFDWIYIDPSRRDNENKKVYYLSDCEPDLTKHLELLFSKSPNILVKTGPLLDLRSGLDQLQYVKEIHIIALENDVKEVLWMLEKDFTQEPIIKTVNFKNSGSQTFEFKMSEERTAEPTYSNPAKYLYEPNAAILKSGAFQSIGIRYGLNKLHPNSHLYTSPRLSPFPGRRFKIQEVLDYSKKSIKRSGISKANITTRNFPDSVAAVRKKLGVKDGGNDYIFCTTDIVQNRILLWCKKM